MTSDAENLVRMIDPKAVVAVSESRGVPVICVYAPHIHSVCDILKKATDFDQLLDIVGIDWQGRRSPRFEVDYLFYSMKKKMRLQLKVNVDSDDKPELDSIAAIYAPANWAEREVFDMFGIRFKNHPKLERLLMWDEFEGHALRKDYELAKRQPIPVAKELL